MWLENSLWGIAAPREVEEMGISQVKQNLWPMLGSPESGHEEGFECKCLFIWRKHRREQESETGREGRQYRDISKLFTAMGKQGQSWETSGTLHIAHLRLLPHEGKGCSFISPPILVHHHLRPAPGALTPRGFLPIQLAARKPQTESCR